MNKVVIFDFDGVIADTFRICYGITKLGDPELTEAAYRDRFNGNINDSIKNEAAKHAVDFFAEFDKRILEAPLVPGIQKAIEYLGTQYSAVIVSSTTNNIIEKYLKHHALRQHFKKIYGNDVATSKVEKFRMIFEGFETQGSNCMLITDTTGDMREAKQVGIQCIAVPWGYQSRSILAAGKPAAFVDTAGEIVDRVLEIFEESRLR